MRIKTHVGRLTEHSRVRRIHCLLQLSLNLVTIRLIQLDVRTIYYICHKPISSVLSLPLLGPIAISDPKWLRDLLQGQIVLVVAVYLPELCWFETECCHHDPMSPCTASCLSASYNQPRLCRFDRHKRREIRQTR